MVAANVWIAKDDGSDIIRATAIAGVGRDYNGNITVRLSGGDQAVVTLITENAHEVQRTPDDFHLQLLRMIAELSDTAGSAIVRPAHDEPNGWKWHSDPL